MRQELNIPGIRDFIEAEVTRQGYKAGTTSHYRMRRAMEAAWIWAWMTAPWPVDMGKEGTGLNAEWVSDLGALVNPVSNFHNNPSQFRYQDVSIQGRRCPRPIEVDYLVSQWCQGVNTTRWTASEAYVEFQLIHPFADGNGRTGKIIFNLLNETLGEPVLPAVPKDWVIP